MVLLVAIPYQPPATARWTASPSPKRQVVALDVRDQLRFTNGEVQVQRLLPFQGPLHSYSFFLHGHGRKCNTPGDSISHPRRLVTLTKHPTF